MPRSGSYFSIASIRPKIPYETRSACSMFGGRPTDTRPATYLTSGAKCRIRCSRASAERSPLNCRHSRSTGESSSTVAALPRRSSACSVTVVPRPVRVRASGAWVGLLVDTAETLLGNMGVGLRSGQGRMAEQLLDGTQVGATFEQVGREAVPKGVGAGA